MTKLYGVSTGEEIVATAWTIEGLGACDADCIVEIPVPPLADLVMDYVKFRGLKIPNTDQAFKFLVSELGELADELVSLDPGWVRNNPDKERGTNEKIAFEAADVLTMLIMTMRELRIDPLQAMGQKFTSKGWKQE